MGHGGQGMGPMGSYASNQGGNQSMPMGSQVGPMGAQMGGMGPGPSQQNWGSGGGRIPTQPQQQEGIFSGGGAGGGQGHPPPQYNVAMAQQVSSLTQFFLFSNLRGNEILIRTIYEMTPNGVLNLCSVTPKKLLKGQLFIYPLEI